MRAITGASGGERNDVSRCRYCAESRVYGIVRDQGGLNSAKNTGSKGGPLASAHQKPSDARSKRLPPDAALASELRELANRGADTAECHLVACDSKFTRTPRAYYDTTSQSVICPATTRPCATSRPCGERPRPENPKPRYCSGLGHQCSLRHHDGFHRNIDVVQTWFGRPRPIFQ